jgi:hypothetical protein
MVVRNTIVEDLLTRLAGVSNVVKVVEAGESDLRITDGVDGSKFCIEVVIGEDEPGDVESSIERMHFPVGAVIYLPSGLTTAAERRAAAHEICGEVYLAYSGDAENQSPVDGARDVQVDVFCGGVALTPNGWATVQVFRVYYGFTRGAPDQAR